MHNALQHFSGRGKPIFAPLVKGKRFGAEMAGDILFASKYAHIGGLKDGAQAEVETAIIEDNAGGHRLMVDILDFHNDKITGLRGFVYEVNTSIIIVRQLYMAQLTAIVAIRIGRMVRTELPARITLRVAVARL